MWCRNCQGSRRAAQAVLMSLLAVVLVAGTASAVGESSHVKLVDGNNVYSPELLVQGGALYMYFGGWIDPGQTHDAIYRAECPHPQQPCTNAVKVIDPVSDGFEHLNDPSIVLHPGGYYIMYMTGVELGQDGLVATNNHIYYSTSWADDGLNWSRPLKLLQRAWLPSVTIRDGNIFLYANRNWTAGVRRYDLGSSGVGVDVRSDGQALNAAFYRNVHVMYRPALGFYQILAQWDTAQIDYLDSSDGLTWNLRRSKVITPQAGQFSVGTPAPNPDTHCWVYLGETPSRMLLDHDIYFSSWC